ncbi:MAG: single-stranded-DNA-specific exonuclease RecJ [Firmicutes bacterium]|nr:single-stranded-DNA-specific exonuclease RecJ [Bacillota bacterium]
MAANNWPWYVPPADEKIIDILAKELGIHRLTAAALYQRGIRTPREAEVFLASDLSSLGNPFLLAGAETATKRLARAVAAREQVLVCGDYDVDGITATALLVLVLRELGLAVEYYIPSRFTEGYGLQAESLRRFAGRGGRLAVTVDCGINSFAEMQLAKDLGLDLIITDHHTCFPGERPALAVLNPKQEHCHYPDKQLAGVGVAFTLLRALFARLGLPAERLYNYLDLVALGTIADVVPLLGENRILVKHGLAYLAHTARPGLQELIRLAGLPEQRLTARQVAFILAPRLNAAGRLGEAGPAVEMLLAEGEEAKALAVELDDLNRRRQQIEKAILAETQLLAATEADAPALVLWREGWNPGVIGIVAGRLAADYGRPVALIALDGKEGRGSIRTAPGYDVIAALHECADLLEHYGGHPEAAGFTLSADRLEAFRAAFCRAVAARRPEEMLVPVEAEASLAEMDVSLAAELAALEPFGHGNPEPLFLLQDLEVYSTRRVGAGGEHLRLFLCQGGDSQTAIFFGGSGQELPAGEWIEAVVSPCLNIWQGREELSLVIRDLRLQEPDRQAVVCDRRGLRQKEQFLAELARRKRVLVWVNTKAVKEALSAALPGRAQVTQLGRDVEEAACDALVLYHIPYDREAFETLLAAVRFSGSPRVYLCFGHEELVLNEKIFAATFPGRETLLKLASYLSPRGEKPALSRIKRCVSFPVTSYLLEQTQAVLAELACGLAEKDWPPTQQQLLQFSDTYRRLAEALARFRTYQNFWWRATAEELSRYLVQPESLNPELEEKFTDDFASTQRAN